MEFLNYENALLNSLHFQLVTRLKMVKYPAPARASCSYRGILRWTFDRGQRERKENKFIRYISTC